MINSDFEKICGKDFAFLSLQKPFKTYNVNGSNVNIDWNLNKFKKED